MDFRIKLLKKIKLSIITVNLNNAEGLRKTIESVVIQTFTDFEYIIIDGGSTDGSVEIIKQYENKITYWTSEPDKGIYNAMNKGILQAKGEYCLFLNSGDYLFDNVLMPIFNKEYVEDILVGNALHVGANGSFLNKGIFDYKSGKITLSDFLYPKCGLIINHQSAFIRKKLFDEYGLYDEKYKIVSDWIFFLNVVGLHSVDVRHFDITICHYNRFGISCVNITLCNEELSRATAEYVPFSILKDYQYYESKIMKLESLDRNYKKLSKYKLSYFAVRLISKAVTLYDMTFSKIRILIQRIRL
jgi:glycosyltransferase involved in cell wall biosynthesis